jgi:hypothetical protein
MPAYIKHFNYIYVQLHKFGAYGFLEKTYLHLIN